MTDYWPGGANGYMDQNGEWSRSSGYKFHKRIFESEPDMRMFTSYRGRNDIRIEAIINVHQSPKTGRVDSFSLLLSVNGEPGNCVYKNRVQSILSATRQAETWLANNDAVSVAMRSYYRNENASTIIDMDGVELASCFRLASGQEQPIAGLQRYVSRDPDGYEWDVSHNYGCTMWSSRPVRKAS